MSRRQARDYVRLLAIAFAVLVVSDVLLAQIAKVVLPPDSPAALRDAERAYRISIEPYHNGLKPNTVATSRSGPEPFTITTNSLGFKDASVREVPLVTSGRRVVLLGDSFTEGVQYPFEKTFAGHIAQHLERQGIEVLNAAEKSYAASIYYAKTKYLVENVGLRFDELIVFLDLSDIHDDGVFYRLTEDGRVISSPDAPGGVVAGTAGQVDRSSTLKDVLKRNSLLVRLADLLKDRIRPVQWQNVPDNHPWFAAARSSPRSAWTYNDTLWREYGAEGRERAAAAMGKLAALLEHHGISLTVVVYPWPAQLFHPEGNDRHAGFWRRWSAAHGARFIDLFPYFPGAPRDVLEAYFAPLEHYWTEHGHRHVAESFLAAYQAGSAQ